MKETLLPHFNKLPQSFRELEFLKMARRYLGLLMALIIAQIIGLTLGQLTFIAAVLAAFFYYAHYLTKPDTPEVAGTDPASPPVAAE